MKPNQWIHTTVDTGLFLQLQDLTTILSGQPDFTFDFSYGSFIDSRKKIMTGSHFWDTSNEQDKISGYKTDLFLRAIGTLKYTAVKDMQVYFRQTDPSGLYKFSRQLVTLLEDMRLEEIIKRERPGTKKDFARRRNFLYHYFETQLAATVTRSLALDELFCLIYLTLNANQPDPSFPQASQAQLDRLEVLKPYLYTAFEASNTSNVIRLAEEITVQLEACYKDMLKDYFTFPIHHMEELTTDTLFDDLTRTDELANDDQEAVDKKNQESIDETFSTWHRESKNKDRKQTMLQMELETGTKTRMLGGATRETEDGDQAMGAIQGTSGKTGKNDYSDLETLEKKEKIHDSQKQRMHKNADNQHAVAVFKYPEAPTAADQAAYKEAAQTIETYKRKLTAVIEKTLEHKRNESNENLVMGRLSKKMLSLIIDDNPRVFYKKRDQSKELDAAFTLLIDCSASMHQKMEETKRSIILFHEVLTRLKVPHAIVGFWEDANDVTDNYQPNYFHVIRSHSDSFHQPESAKIMQLEPKEDNRDGFSIRLATKTLAARREKNKFLLVFSDGEPAAAGYNQNGIVDTNVAVSAARKKGVHVIGTFLADGDIDEREDEMMKNIYGKDRLMIPSISDLPDYFAPLLKRLLLRTF
ncbi:vWA domain-containing protein [Bacillus piscicola]|uniref:vWA domain-containing protein n=1 Tax=Bacillus piscicola TaxID=1632684 RepID=UPI001F094A64|nr:VWA domain-containing protein [Bacillus piscicola]